MFLLSFNRVAVPGSIIDRTSFTSWLTLGPTSPAPIRMTMLLGALAALDTGTDFPVGPLFAPIWVRFFVLLRAIFAVVVVRWRELWIVQKK